jgi:hypothetical protein
MEYLVIFEEAGKSVGAYVPDLPGCVAVGETRGEAKQLIREAIELHNSAPPGVTLLSCGSTNRLTLTRNHADDLSVQSMSVTVC